MTSRRNRSGRHWALWLRLRYGLRIRIGERLLVDGWAGTVLKLRSHTVYVVLDAEPWSFVDVHPTELAHAQAISPFELPPMREED